MRTHLFLLPKSKLSGMVFHVRKSKLYVTIRYNSLKCYLKFASDFLGKLSPERADVDLHNGRDLWVQGSPERQTNSGKYSRILPFLTIEKVEVLHRY